MNKTTMYLGPSLFTSKVFNSMVRLFRAGVPVGMYVDDMEYIAYNLNPNCLFIKMKYGDADAFINRHSEDLVDYYDIGDYIIILIEIFLENKDWKKDFLLGKYSKIYTEKELLETNIEKIKFTGEYEYMNKRYQVLTKDTKGYWDKYIEDMNVIFNGGIHFQQDDRELDLPPELKNEILNYK